MKLIHSKDYFLKGVDDRGWYIFESKPGKYSDPEEVVVPRAKYRMPDGTVEILDYYVSGSKSLNNISSVLASS